MENGIHRIVQTSAVIHAKHKQQDEEAAPASIHPHPRPPRTLVRLLDGEQERQEQRAEEDHAEGSANDMDVE